MTLILVRHADDVDLARALVAALEPHLPLFVLFAQEDLRDRFGPIGHPNGTDTATCMLNPEYFDAVVSFFGPCDSNLATNLQVISYFQEIGIAALEIQRGLFQHGFAADAPLSAWASVGNVSESAALNPGYAAQRWVSWGGPQGIGYLKSELCSGEAAPFQNANLVLVTSHTDWTVYSDKHRYQFALAVLRLAGAHPDKHFIWRTRDAEHQHSEARHVLNMVEDYRLANLTFERVEPVDRVLARCAFGITMLGTSLLDFQFAEKPVLVYACPVVEEIATGLSLPAFHDYAELESRWTELHDGDAAFRVDTGLRGLDAGALLAEVRAAQAKRKLSADWLPKALKYLAYVREGRTARNEIGKLSNVLSTIDKNVKGVDARIEQAEEAIGTRVHEGVSLLGEQLLRVQSWFPKLADRVSVLQRSTLAYKARKLVTRIGG